MSYWQGKSKSVRDYVWILKTNILQCAEVVPLATPRTVCVDPGRLV